MTGKRSVNYYVEQTTRHGDRRLIRIDTEHNGEASGMIVASDQQEEIGQPWSNRLSYLARRSREGTRPQTRYDFTLQPFIDIPLDSPRPGA